MDMQAAAERHELERAIDNAKAEYSTMFVAPRPDESPDDGILVYADVVSVKDLLPNADRHVLLFSEQDSDLLEMLIKYQDRFEIRPQVLVGLPSASYSPWWDSVTWMLDKSSYPTLISELSLDNRVNEEQRVANRSTVEVEQDQYTRKDGTVKDHTKYELSLPDDEDDL